MGLTKTHHRSHRAILSSCVLIRQLVAADIQRKEESHGVMSEECDPRGGIQIGDLDVDTVVVTRGSTAAPLTPPHSTREEQSSTGSSDFQNGINDSMRSRSYHCRYRMLSRRVVLLEIW
ncbi:hypothetical protein CDAR_282941 [Caerostris darwini]|uniref:Uncharacterized protein n=1 Tax=Caerostris darwini TaxID=1538125 RepID=A0AAV4W848_9ARAC|nr:hypothetical protein CDAR_282941 [Caerostris darwini]